LALNNPAHKKKVVIIGPGYPLRGGLATFDHRLCKQFIDEGYECCIFSFSLQYPSILFPGKTQYSSDPAPEGLEIYSIINSIHPLNWWQTGNELKRMRPDIIVVRYWLPFMGPALGTIARRAKKNKHTRVVAITDNIFPHEKRPGDIPFSRYFLRSCDAFVTMSEKVMQDLRQFEKEKPAVQVMHPLYDNFGEPVTKEEARKHLGLNMEDHILLFFGFIRKYKGLDTLLEALRVLKENNSPLLKRLKIMVAGEFYEDPKEYNRQMDEYGIRDYLILRTDFIADTEVKYYFCAADGIVQPYHNATQSGVTPLAYHFNKPMIVTNVGGLPDLVPHKKAGLVCEPQPASLASSIEQYFELGESYFFPHLRIEKQRFSWHNLVNTITELAKINNDLQK
jgi:glycosyltransferase involved in cell wall biosynthesis